MKLNHNLQERLIELFEEIIKPELGGIHFKSSGEVREGIQFLVEHMESINPEELTDELTMY